MMIAHIKARAFVAEGLPAQVHQKAKAIGIGQNAGEGDQAAIAGVVGCFGGDDPTAEQMSERRHRRYFVCAKSISTRGPLSVLTACGSSWAMGTASPSHVLS